MVVRKTASPLDKSLNGDLVEVVVSGEWGEWSVYDERELEKLGEIKIFAQFCRCRSLRGMLARLPSKETSWINRRSPCLINVQFLISSSIKSHSVTYFSRFWANGSRLRHFGNWRRLSLISPSLAWCNIATLDGVCVQYYRIIRFFFALFRLFINIYT